MGLLYPRHDEDESRPPNISNSPADQGVNTNPAATDPWLVVVIVIGVLIITTLAIFMLAHCIKSRQRRTKCIQATQSMSSLYPRKRKLSSADRDRVEEMEREMMIRKSLASRTSFTASSPISQTFFMSSDSHVEEPSEDQGEMASLQADWKAWEARMQSERDISCPGGVSLDQHPAFASHLSIPQPIRIPSPIRGVIPSHIDPPRIMIT
jgi:hypothetical protein